MTPSTTPLPAIKIGSQLYVHISGTYWSILLGRPTEHHISPGKLLFSFFGEEHPPKEGNFGVLLNRLF